MQAYSRFGGQADVFVAGIAEMKFLQGTGSDDTTLELSPGT
jgi:hypothetical protein